MRTATMFVLIAVVVIAAGYYVHRHASATLGLGPRGRKALAAVIGGGIAATLAGRLFSDALGSFAEHVSVVGSIISLGVLVSAVLLLVVDAGRGVVMLVQRIRARRREPEPVATEPHAVPKIPRRAFVARAAAGSALLVGSSSSLYGALFGRHDYQLEEVVVPVRGLARTLEGFTIVQISDIHFGTFVGEPELRAAVELIRRARPDLVVLTGDLLDHDDRFAHLLGKLIRSVEPFAREGVAVIPGNHDYYAGVDVVLRTARAAGATVLRNSARVIGDGGGALALVGVDDLWARRRGPGHGPDLARALAMVPADLPRVLLCHNPAFFPEASKHVALQLSGHTHGGQVNPAGIRVADLVLPFGYVSGIYQRDTAHLYVNRGFGTAGPPARVGAPPEITRLRLIAA